MGNKKVDESKSNKYIPVKVKVLIIILPVIITTISILIVVSYHKSKNIIEEKAYLMLDSSAKNQKTQIENWFNNNLETFNTIKQSLGSTDYSMEGMKKVLNQYYKFNQSFSEGLYISDLNGNVITADDSGLNFDNAASSEWFQEGLTHIRMNYGSPHKNSSGNNVISATGLIVNNGEPVGVIGADVTLDRISIISNSLIDMEDAQSFLVNRDDGKVLASSDSLQVGSILDIKNSNHFYAETAKKIDSNNYDAEIIDGNIVEIKDVSNTNLTFVTYVPKKSILKSLYSLGNYMLIIALAALIILVIIIFKSVNYMINPINDISKKIIKMSKGDFTIDINTESKDEIGVMSRSLKNFIESMKKMINEIQRISVEQKNESLEGRKISKTLFESSEYQSESMKNLNIVVGEFADSTTEIAKTATGLVEIASRANKNGDKLKKKMHDTVKISQYGKDDMKYVGDSIDVIQGSIKQLENLIDEVSKSSGEINNIVSIIGDIAKSTNLLALNASIEAARAGESGKGFAVVADEIGSLANSSSDSVNDIADLIENISSLIEKVVKKVHESVKKVNESSNLIINTIGTFDKIYSTIDESDALVNNMLLQIEDVNKAADNMAAISEEQAVKAKEISKTSQVMMEYSKDISISSKNVAENASSLSHASKKLEDEVEKFKL